MRASIIPLLLPFFLAGCHTIETPVNFVQVERGDLGGYHVRAMSADGVVVGLRTQDNPKRGTLEFWSAAMQNELTGRGYRLVKAEDIRGASGQLGRLMEFATDQRGTGFTYLLATYVTDSTVLLAEAGGKTEAVDKYRPRIRQSLLTAR